LIEELDKVISTTPAPLLRVHPSFAKEGKVLIFNIITFSSSLEEEYPDGTAGGGGGLIKQSHK
jgi:hypothetical protein